MKVLPDSTSRFRVTASITWRTWQTPWLGPGKQRDLETAAARGMEAIALAEGLQSATVGAFYDLYDQMTPHADVPAVQEFLERGRTLVNT